MLTPPANSASSFLRLKLLMPMLRTRPFCTKPSMWDQVVAMLGFSSGPEQPETTGQWIRKLQGTAGQSSSRGLREYGWHQETGL